MNPDDAHLNHSTFRSRGKDRFEKATSIVLLLSIHADTCVAVHDFYTARASKGNRTLMS